MREPRGGRVQKYRKKEDKIMERIVDLTMHTATAEQVERGVFEPTRKEDVKKALLFTELPTKESMKEKAEVLTEIALEEKAEKAMIGGALYFMPILAETLKAHGITPLFAFTERVSVEKTTEDGTVVKTSEFKFIDFVEA